MAEFDIIFGKGISILGCVIDLAEETGVVIRKGAWYSYNGDNIAQGRDNAIKYLEEHPEVAQEVQQQVRQKLEMGAAVSANSVTSISDEADEMEIEAEE